MSRWINHHASSAMLAAHASLAADHGARDAVRELLREATLLAGDVLGWDKTADLLASYQTAIADEFGGGPTPMQGLRKRSSDGNGGAA